MIPRRALIPFVVAGQAVSLDEVAAGGADLIELGIPYSDPLADGPVIQEASQRALEQGMNLDKVFALAKDFSARHRTPLVLFTYYNPVLRQGVGVFCQRAAEAGAKGLIVPDLPLEEADELKAACRQHGLAWIPLVAPTSSRERRLKIAQAADSWIYLVATVGVTGARSQLAEGLAQSIRELKAVTDKPVAVGFGIATPEQAAEVIRLGADAVVVGSALVRVIESGGRPAEYLGKLKQAITQA